MDFQLRPLEIGDLDALVENANNDNISAFMTDDFPYPYTKEHGMDFLMRFKDMNPTQIFAIVIQGKLSGAIGIHPQRGIMKRNAELGYWLAEPFWGNGIISKAIAEMLEYSFETFDIDRIYARPFGNNVASQRVLEKCGFTLEARYERVIIKRGQRLDELVYGYRKP